MIIDMHAHVWRNRQEQSLRTIRRAADIYHLDKVLISGLGSYSPDQAEISLLNAAVAAICEEDPLFAGIRLCGPAAPRRDGYPAILAATSVHGGDEAVGLLPVR